MKDKVDFKKEMKSLFQPPIKEFVEVDVPEMGFVMVDGKGDPNKTPGYAKALEWLYSTSYAMKFASKTRAWSGLRGPATGRVVVGGRPEGFYAPQQGRMAVDHDDHDAGIHRR